MCPTCRHLAVIDDQSPKTSPIIKSLIENLQIRCKNQLDREEEVKERELNGIASSPSQVKYASVESCTWKGTLSEYSSHLESSCPLELVHCCAEGCTSRHMRGYMKSGYCQNSECVVNTARKVLAKKQQLESSDILFEKIDLSSTGEMARKKRTEVLSNWLVNADENKENKPKDDLTEDKEMPKKAALENQFQRTSQKQQHNPPLKERKQNTSVATRVYVEAESSKLSNMSIEGAAYKGISPDFKVIPTNWALIQDTTVNSVRFTTNLSARVIPCADDKPCLKRVDSCVISHAGTMGSSDTLDAFRVQTSFPVRSFWTRYATHNLVNLTALCLFGSVYHKVTQSIRLTSDPDPTKVDNTLMDKHSSIQVLNFMKFFINKNFHRSNKKCIVGPRIDFFWYDNDFVRRL